MASDRGQPGVFQCTGVGDADPPTLADAPLFQLLHNEFHRVGTAPAEIVKIRGLPEPQIVNGS